MSGRLVQPSSANRSLLRGYIDAGVDHGVAHETSDPAKGIK
jgi:hypothetical protein